MPKRKEVATEVVIDTEQQLERRLRRLLKPAIDPPELMDAIWGALEREDGRSKGRSLAQRVAALEDFRAEKYAEGWLPEYVAAEQARRPGDKYVTRSGGIAPRNTQRKPR